MDSISSVTKQNQYTQNNGQSLISVIVPVYNVEPFLPYCLDTIAQQTYHKLEIIIVDDGSTDNSGQISDDFSKKDSRARVIHQQNQGLYAARNTGQKAATGDYFMFIDSDDYIHLDMVNILYEAINQDEGYDMAIVGRKITQNRDEDITRNDENKAITFNQDELISNMFTHPEKSLFIYVWNKLYRRELLDDVLSNAYLRGQDQDFNFRVFLKTKKAILIDRELYFWYQRADSLTHQADTFDIWYKSITEMMYQNFINLPTDKQQYDHYLLRCLYRKMVSYKNRVWKKENGKEVFEKCRFYEKNTRNAYWKNSKINFFEKIFVTILLHNNFLTRWLRKVTHNC